MPYEKVYAFAWKYKMLPVLVLSFMDMSYGMGGMIIWNRFKATE